jgi:hypothetical protein
MKYCLKNIGALRHADGAVVEARNLWYLRCRFCESVVSQIICEISGPCIFPLIRLMKYCPKGIVAFRFADSAKPQK